MAKSPVKEPKGEPPVPVPDMTITLDDNIKSQIEDALNLLEFAIASGFKTTAGAGIDQPTVVAIKGMAAKRSSGELKLADWINFELAYHALAALLAPVSAETLQDTRDQEHMASPARRFTKILWVLTAIFAVTIIIVELCLKAFGAPESPAFADRTPVQKEWLDSLMHLGQLLEPYAYGGLGACAYLLRSAHIHIYRRTFDLRRRSEYYNRIILGLVAGGAIFLFVNNTVGDDSSTVQLSSGALAFIAGYSNDFLFNAIQRIVNAIFPKNDDDDKPAGRPRAPAQPRGAGSSHPLGGGGGQ